MKRRLALGVSYFGQPYHGWQSQPDGQAVQDQLEHALQTFCQQPVHTLCAGRTDAGVHAVMQVVHLDTELDRPMHAWVRGTNTYLPRSIAVQWAHAVDPKFHARASALSRRYAYLLLESQVRPSLEYQRVGWVFRPLSLQVMEQALKLLVGTHDFSSFRSAQCQSPSPVKTLLKAQVKLCGPSGVQGRYWRFDFEGTAFLHHMIRNIMGCLVWIGQGIKPPDWMHEVLMAKNRDLAAPTFAADGLYFLGPTYAPQWNLPTTASASDFLPC